MNAVHNFRVHFAIRSFHYWASVPVTKFYLHPLTVYRSLLEDDERVEFNTYCAARTVNVDAVRKLSVDLVTHWTAPFTHVNIHAVYWSLASFSIEDQLEIANKFLHHHPGIMKQDDAQKIPADIMLRLTQNLDSLEASLLAQDPMMPTHLRNTHQLLISYPESVHLLQDSEIATLITAAQKHSNIVITAAAAKSPAGRKKISADDL